MLKLEMQEMHVSGRYGYHAVDADHGGATIITGITKKLANNIIGIVGNAISEFCKINRLATLLQDLETLEPSIYGVSVDLDHGDSDSREAAKRVCQWIKDHNLTEEEKGKRFRGDADGKIAYLSVENEKYAQEAAERRRLTQEQV